MGEIEQMEAKLAECHKQMDELEDALSRTVAERYAATARAEAAEQRAEALAAEVVRLRADARMMAGRYFGVDDSGDADEVLGLNDAELAELDFLAVIAFERMSAAEMAEVMRRVLRAEAQPAEVPNV